MERVMQTLVREGKYKVIEYLSSDESYISAVAVDIEDNEHRLVLINTYLDPLDIRRFVPLFYDASRSGYDGFVEYYTEFSRVNVVFRYHSGKKLKQVFHKGSTIDRKKRLEMEEELLHEAVLMSAMPQELLCAVLRAENAVVNLDSGRLKFNMVARPENIERTEWLTDQLGEMSEMILKRRFTTPARELDFLDRLRTGGFESVAAVYSAWREIRPALEDDYEKQEKDGPVATFLGAVRTHLTRRKKASQYKKAYRERLARRGVLVK